MTIVYIVSSSKVEGGHPLSVWSHEDLARTQIGILSSRYGIKSSEFHVQEMTLDPGPPAAVQLELL